jgi:uncharacterized repeat protein (TIGR01451 family)
MKRWLQDPFTAGARTRRSGSPHSAGARRGAATALFHGALLLAGTSAQAAVIVNKTFSPASMTVGGTSTVTITLGNTGTSAATGAAFTDNLPAGVVVASPSSVATTCGGTATANPGSGTISLSGGTIAPNGGTCTVTAAVTSSTIGSYTNTIPAGGVTSSQGSNGAAASATLAVIASQPVTGSFDFSWPAGFGGALKGYGPAATIKITFSNANTLALTNAGLTVQAAQPVLAFATPANESTTCGGSFTLDTVAMTGTLTGGTIPANGSCSVQFDVIAAQPNAYYYGNGVISVPVGGITDNEGITNSAAIYSYLVVQTGARVDKAFTPASIISGGTSTLKLTIHNLNYAVLSPINLSDALPSNANGTMIVAPTPNASTTCGGTLTAAAGSSSIQLSGGSLASVPPTNNGSITCTVAVDVVGTSTGTAPINLTNSIPAGSFGAVNYPAAAANLTVTPNIALYGSSKVIANEYYAGSLIGTPGTVHAMTITLSNPATSPVTVTSLTDDLTTMGTGFTVAASPAASTTCVGGTVSAPAGGTLITMAGGTIPAGDGTNAGTCTLSAAIYVPMIPSALGNHYNTIPAGNIVTSAGSNATAIYYGVSFVTPVAIGKSFAPAAVNPGGMSTLTINITRMLRSGETGVDPLTNISDTDTLPAGMVIDTPSGLTTTCPTGSVTAPAGGSTISFSGINLDAGVGCTIKVNVRVPAGTPPGVLQNVIPSSSATTDQGFTNGGRPTSGGSWGDGSAAANLTVGNANVTINKTFTPATVSVGTASQLAINFVNTNPGNIQLTQAALTDALPLGMSVASPVGASFTGTGCAGTVTATAGATSVGLSNATINAGATCTLNVNVVGTAAGNLINTIPAGALTSIQAVTNTAPATATLQATGTANLAITKTDNATQVATGTTTTYTVVVSNAGPNNVIGATVTDTPPAGMTFTGWTCTASSGASCGAASGTGAISDTININTGSTVTYTVTAQVAPNFAGTSITNAATVTPPGIVADPNQANNTASDIDTVVPGVVLALTKDDGSATYTPGGTATYTVTVKNTGPATATQVSVSDTLPAGVTLSGNVTCTAAGTASCGTVTGGAGQTSFGATNATIPPGASNALTFTVPVAFASTLTTSPLVNTVSASDAPSGATATASDSDTLSASANVSIVKTGPASVVPGGAIRYTLTIANAGPSAANNATFSDAVPASITGVTASCGGAAGGAACPPSVNVAGNTVSGTIPTLPPGGSVVITIDGTTAASTATPITNTATVAPPSGTSDPVPGNNTSPWTTSLKPVVRIDKTVDATSVIPGGTVTYTITVTNTGTVSADGTLVTDPVPNGITSQTWTCVGSGGAVCTPSGSGAINDTLAALPPGGAVVYTVTATVATLPPTNINNTATATPPNGACAPTMTPAPCSDTASLPPVPQIGVSKTADATTVTPGGTIHYTIVVSNTGVVAADGTPVSDPLPAGIASQSWTCAASGGASCTAASGSGAISDTLATFPAGSFVTYTVTATVDANPPAIVSNTVTVTPLDPSAVCTPGNTPGPCTATANVTSNAQISLTKTADTSTLTPGGTVTYTVTVTNTGQAPADGTTVEDPMPAGIASQTWTCAANAGAVCTASGAGDISDTLTAFPPGSFVTYTITATLADSPPATVTNLATANPPPGGLCTPGNTPAPCDAEVSGGAVPQIGITKTSDTTGSLTPGGTVTYTVTVTNAGSADAGNTLVSDALPAGLDAATWTCAGSGGAVCPNATGTGAISETLATFPSGSSVVYTIVGTVSATPPASIVNTASAMPPAGVCLPGNTAPPCTATVSNASAPQIQVTKTADDASYVGGGTLSWTVTVTNTGSASADGTTVADPLPAGVVSSAWTCVPSGGAVCGTPNGTGALAETIAAFPPGSAVTYLISGTVATPAPTTITNTVAASPPAGGTCAPGNAAPPCTATSTTASAPNVAIAKSVADANGNGIAEPGETLTYTIVLTNSGGSDATGFGVTDPLDANVAFVSADGGGVLTGQTVTWSGLTVAAGGTVTVHVVATVAAPLPAGVTQIANVAYETGTTAPACPPIGPGCVVLPTPGVVTLTKSVIDASGDGLADPGESLSYTITLTNTGGSDVGGYGVTDPLDPNLVFVSADNGGVETGGVVTWSDLTVPAGGSLDLTLVATVADPLAGVTEIANGAYETGTTAPACPPAGPQCVVLPTPGTATIAKTVADQNGNGVADPGETLTYTILLSNAGGSDVTNFGVTDPLDANVTFVSASHGGTLAGGVVSWSGLTVPAGGNLALTVVVTVASPIPNGVSAIRNVAYPSTDTPPDCAATPRPANCSTIATAPKISIAKTAGTPTPTGTPNTFTLTYTATVTNTGGSVGHYDLADTLAFNGATVTAISPPAYASTTGDVQTGVLGSFVSPTGGTIVTNEDLAAGGVETWTYTVSYTVTDGALASDCANPLGGLRNSATLGGAAAGAPAETCTGSASVNLLKTAATPVPTGNPNEYTLTYTVDVSNTGTLPGVYDLSDVLTFAGATVSAITPPAYASSTGDTQDGTPGTFQAPDGGVVVSGESIAAGGRETWTYTVTYTITDAAAAEDCADPAGGLRNAAALGGSFAGQSATCTGAPAVVVGKSASGPVPTGQPNEYAVTYQVTVQNHGSLVGTYDLDDTFTFPGVGNVTVGAVAHDGPDPLASTLGTLDAGGGTIVLGETIAAGASEAYTYTVTFTVDSAAAVGTCAAGGGLANEARLGGSASGQVATCTDVPDVAIAKTASGPVPTGVPDQYALTYTVTVSNAGAAAGTYDLADTFAYAGATIDAVGAVAHGGTDPLATTLGTLTPAGGTIVTGETLAAGASESYTYTVTFTQTDPAAANDCTAAANGLRNTATLGGSASGTAATCNGAPSVAIAKALTGESGAVAGAAEPGETLTYTITLTNAGAADQTDYGVTDPLDPNVTFVSADHGGTFAGGAVSWSGLTVPAHGTLTLSVAVRVADPIAAGVAAVGNLAYATGATPPDCTASPLPANCTTIPVNPGTVAIAKAVADADGDGQAAPGEALTYTITLTNSGGGDVTGYGVTDPLDANVAFASADHGGVYAGGAVTWSNLTIPAKGQLTLTLVATVVEAIPPGVSAIGNVAYATGTPPPDCTASPRPANCATIPVSPGTVAIAKAVIDADGDGQATPGETLTYTITLTNSGGGDATLGLADPLDANLRFVSADNGGTLANGTVTWTNLTVPANGSVTLTLVTTVADPLPAGVAAITNVAYASGTAPADCSAVPTPPSCAVIAVPPPGAVTIAKTVADANGDGQATPGETLTYTIALTNGGGQTVTGYGVTDPLDANVAFVSADNGGTYANGAVTWSNLTIPANGSVTLTLVATVADPLPAGVAAITNVAYASGTAPADCSAVPTPPSCAVIAAAPPAGAPVLRIGKSASASTVAPGATLAYTIRVENVGTAAATGVVVSDPIPAGIASYAWTCTAEGGAACANASGHGALAEPVPALPVGGAVVYTVTATLAADPPSGIRNVADVSASGAVTCAPAGTAPPCTADVTVTVLPGGGTTPVSAPANELWALLLLALSLLGTAWHAARRRM